MDADERKDLGIEIRSMRGAQRPKMRQEDLAAKAGVSVRTIRNLEAGRKVDDGTLGQVINALGYKAPTARWPKDIQTFLDMIGYRLQRLDGPDRDRLIGEVTRVVIAPMQES